ncbi:N-methyl-L-tryptophan oxidase [Bacillus sp. UNC41MFS5]|uniref:N-methyl-L-tryptophan oxidase n=1 Tax=Bacillus sp. UNC41MFS5 TaxID=1449046 RepID=UPI00047B4FE2|nr:N-methyl-L-tryptophan oxidase [Bacillus sp. UNC41MFS5]
MKEARIGVIGVGTMGSMAMWQLARKGITSVIGFEQFHLGHDRSAAGGESRAFRKAYLEGSRYVPLLIDSRLQWRELEQETNTDLLTLNGGLMIGSEQHESMKTIFECVRAHHLDHEIFEPAQAKLHYPQHPLNSGEVMILDKQAGFIRPERSVLTAARRAEDIGATILRKATVQNIIPHSNGVTVMADDRVYEFEKVIVTAGPWLNKLLPALKDNFEVNRLLLTWFTSERMKQFSPERFPIFVRFSEEINLFGVPSLDGSMVKIAPVSDQGDGPVKNPDSLDRNVLLQDIEKLIQGVKSYLPDLIPEPVRVTPYIDGYTPDHAPLVGFLPGNENVIVMGGFSGHGFKFAPLMGRIASELVLTGETQYDIGFMDPARFLKVKYSL